jgi:hypothetical protein
MWMPIVMHQSKHGTTLDHHQEDLKLAMLPEMLDAIKE